MILIWTFFYLSTTFELFFSFCYVLSILWFFFLSNNFIWLRVNLIIHPKLNYTKTKFINVIKKWWQIFFYYNTLIIIHARWKSMNIKYILAMYPNTSLWSFIALHMLAQELLVQALNKRTLHKINYFVQPIYEKRKASLSLCNFVMNDFFYFDFIKSRLSTFLFYIDGKYAWGFIWYFNYLIDVKKKIIPKIFKH